MASFLYLNVIFLFAVLSGLLLSVKAISPPRGNYVLMSVEGRGYQMYQCNDTKSWQSVQAKATLYTEPEGNNDIVASIGWHYFLPHPDTNGGRPTWLHYASAEAANFTEPVIATTGKVLARKPMPGNIDSLLLQATSYLGENNQISYIQRIPITGGLAPAPELCQQQPWLVKNVYYESKYVFWSQSKEPALAEGQSKYNKSSATYFAEGYQHYTYNGSAWLLHNATAALSSLPGREVVGTHYFRAEKDSNGGQPTWEIFSPFSGLTAKVVNRFAVDNTSIPLLDLERTSSAGDGFGIGNATKIQRLSTRGGLPPEVPGAVGQEYSSLYSAIYWFYV